MLASCQPTDWHQVPFDDTRDYSGAAPVFPGAEGFGSTTVAGRGGPVIRVTTLDADGPGSLRAALRTPGPRTVVFEVGGVIDVVDALDVTEPFVTVAGQTAPAPGITLFGAGMCVRTHDVLIQHIRIRVGDRTQGPVGDARDGLSVVGDTEAYNVVIDHCSVSWAIDEAMSTWGRGVHDVTFSHCILGENLAHSIHPKGEHSKGMLIGDHARRVAVIGNLFAHSTERCPLIKGDVSALVLNNLIYNPGKNVIHLSDPEGSGPSRATIIGNVLIRGADTGWFTRMIHPLYTTKRGTVLYMEDNGQRKPNGPLSKVAAAYGIAAPVSLAPLTIRPASTIEGWVLATAGSRPAERDSVDTRIVESVTERTGRIIDRPTQVGGLPPIAPQHHTLTLPDSPTATSGSGPYTNLELWLHRLSAEVEKAPANPQ